MVGLWYTQYRDGHALIETTRVTDRALSLMSPNARLGSPIRKVRPDATCSVSEVKMVVDDMKLLLVTW